MRDSNPRMVGPEPTALPLGESPTDNMHYSTRGKKMQNILGYVRLIFLCYNRKSYKHKK